MLSTIGCGADAANCGGSAGSSSWVWSGGRMNVQLYGVFVVVPLIVVVWFQVNKTTVPSNVEACVVLAMDHSALPCSLNSADPLRYGGITGAATGQFSAVVVSRAYRTAGEEVTGRAPGM